MEKNNDTVLFFGATTYWFVMSVVFLLLFTKLGYKICKLDREFREILEREERIRQRSDSVESIEIQA